MKCGVNVKAGMRRGEARRERRRVARASGATCRYGRRGAVLGGSVATEPGRLGRAAPGPAPRARAGRRPPPAARRPGAHALGLRGEQLVHCIPI